MLMGIFLQNSGRQIVGGQNRAPLLSQLFYEHSRIALTRVPVLSHFYERTFLREHFFEKKKKKKGQHFCRILQTIRINVIVNKSCRLLF